MGERQAHVSLVSLVYVLLLVSVGVKTSHGQFSFGASNYYGVGGGSNYFGVGSSGSSYMNNGLWWIQNQCPWGSAGLRNPSQFQCGSFSCPSYWFGTTSYQCPPPALYSNSLQRCVHPVALANSCHA